MLTHGFSTILQSVLTVLVCWCFPIIACAQESEVLDSLIFDPVLLEGHTPDHKDAQGVGMRPVNLLNLYQGEIESNQRPPTSEPAVTNLVQDINAYTEVISDLEREEGPFSPLLIQNFLILADLFQQQENHLQAISLLERADHISRVNNGLYHRGQQIIIEGLVKSYLAREDFESIKEKQRYLQFLNQKLAKKGNPDRVQAFAEMADFNMETFEQSLLVTPDPDIASMFRVGGMDAPGAPEYARFFALDSLYLAKSSYSEAISELIDNQDLLHPDLVQLEYKYLESIFLVGFSGELMFNPHYYLTSARTTANLPNRWTYLRRNKEGYEQGVKTFERILKYLDTIPSATALHRVSARIEFGDWHQIFGWNEAASTEYAKAYSMAQQSGLEAEFQKMLFMSDKPVQLPLFTAKPNSREKFSISPDTPLQYAGYIDVSFYINRNGTARGIRMLNKSDSLAFDVEDRLRRYLKNSPFRPHIVNGEKVDAENVRMRYYYSFL